MSAMFTSVRASARAGGLILKSTFREYFGQNGMFLSAGLAFYVLLYCFPLLLLFVTALGYTIGESERALAGVQMVVGKLVPASEQAVAETFKGVVATRNLLGVAAAGSFLLFGTFLFGAVRHVVNTVFGVSQRRSFFKALAADVFAMLGAGGLLVLTLGLISVFALVVDVAARIPLLEPWVRPNWAFTGRVASVVFSWALLYLLYRVAPAKSLSRRGLLAASICGVFLLELSKELFDWYVQAATDYAVLYGALGGLIFFILWIYYASSVFVFSATLGKTLDRSKGSPALAQD